ncbi:hypothetical protein GCM10027578_38030 [Spirosoma luteolum]
MELTFDWAKLETFDEQRISEPIIMGKTILSLTGVRSEQFRFYAENENYSLVPLPDDLMTGLAPIGTNEIDDETNSVKISGLYTSKDNQSNWVEWIFHFATCQLSWTSYVTHTEWLNGKLPSD